MINYKDKLHNFSDKVLNNLINIAKLKEKILINKKTIGEINVPIKNTRPKLDNYKKQQKYFLDHQVNSITMNILLVKIYYHQPGNK